MQFLFLGFCFCFCFEERNDKSAKVDKALCKEQVRAFIPTPNPARCQELAVEVKRAVYLCIYK